MCGDLEEDEPGHFESLLYARFVGNAGAILEHQNRQKTPDDEVVASIDKLFTDALGRAVKDVQATEDGKNYEMLSMQPLVFARLAGFLAGHLSLHEDPLHKVMEAMMHGYREAGEMEPDHGHDHGDGHHHHH